MAARKKRGPAAPELPPRALETLVEAALNVAKTAKRNHKSLSGSNFYAEKLARMRADATNIFRDLSGQSAGDVSAMAEMIQDAFGPTTSPKRRRESARELLFSLRTTWRASGSRAPASLDRSVLPLELLEPAGRSYLLTLGRQINGCYSADWYDASLVMMRRLLEVAIIDAYEEKSISHKVKGADGNYLHLTDLIGKALSETAWCLSRNAKKFLPQLRDLGHLSAHGKYFTARARDVEDVRLKFRVVVEELLGHAGLV